jgi:hypothetical protein
VEAHARCTATRIELPDGRARLLVEIEIDCPACGRYKVALADHHLRMVRDALIEVIDANPDLTGKDGDVRTVDRFSFQAPGPGDPQTN